MHSECSSFSEGGTVQFADLLSSLLPQCFRLIIWPTLKNSYDTKDGTSAASTQESEVEAAISGFQLCSRRIIKESSMNFKTGYGLVLRNVKLQVPSKLMETTFQGSKYARLALICEEKIWLK